MKNGQNFTRNPMGMVLDPCHVSVTCHVSRVTFFLTFDWIELQRSYLHVKWSEFHQESNEHGPRPLSRVRHASRVTCHVFSNFWLDWATEKLFTCKMVRISPGIQWAWSQTRDTCPSRVTCHVSRFLLTFDWIELQKSYLHVKWSEFHQESIGHGPRPVSCVYNVTPVCGRGWGSGWRCSNATSAT